jgi:general stress protein YciG
MAEEGKGEMTVSEAGHRGGEKTAETHGHEFYEEIGKKGGEVGGPKGGETTKEKYGHEFYEEIGHKGGQKVRELIEEGKKTEGD